MKKNSYAKKKNEPLKVASISVFVMFLTVIILIFGQKMRKETGAKNEIKVSSISPENYKLDPSYFYILGNGDIENVKMVGIMHGDIGEISHVNELNNNASRYDKFWQIYLSRTKKNPADIILATEDARSPKNGIGEIYQKKEPEGFITPYLFSINLRKIVTCNTRPPVTTSDQQELGMILGIFDKSGGQLDVTNKTDKLGMPIIKIKRKPNINSEDWKKLNDIWYPKYYLENQKFEDMLVTFIKQTQAIPVVGAAHAINIYRNSKVNCISIALSNDDLINAYKSLAITDYYLKIIRKE